MSNAPNKSKPTDEVPPVRAFGRGNRIFAGLALGVGCGVMFGEWCQYLRIFGDAYVGLLQMTVLPYLVVALIQREQPEQAIVFCRTKRGTDRLQRRLAG